MRIISKIHFLMNKKIFIFTGVILPALPKTAFAVCPVCTVAVGAGLGLAQWLGIDDSISGLWIGALAVSISLWTISWLDKRNLKFKGRKILIFAGYYAIVVLPLWWKGFIGKDPLNEICGMDKLLYGIILGTILFVAGVLAHNWLRKRNEDKSYFKGQKIVAAVAPLVIASIILYFTC